MILDHLKAQTSDLHRETEEDNLARFILDHSITTSQYMDLLQQNWFAYHSIDQLIFANESQIPSYLKEFTDRAKSEALQKDLKAINYISESSKLNSDRAITGPMILGMIYVTEGSMMGGLLIRKNLESCTLLNSSLEHHFFGKSAPEVMKRWNAFKKAVNEQEFSDAEMEEAVAGAKLAFTIFKKSYALV